MTSEKSTYNIKDGHVFDIEVYPNWAYVLFQEPNGTFVSFEFKENYPAPKKDLTRYIAGKNLVSFNGNHYDDHIFQHLISSTSTPVSTYELSKQLIESDKYRKPATVKSIDLMGSTGQVSLKLLAVRMGWPKLEELPFDPTKPVDATAISHHYCKNDVLITAELYKRMVGALKNRQCLSEKYGVDLLSATEPNIAETVITSEYEKQTGLNKYALKKLAKKPTTVTLTCPEWFDSITHPALKGFVDKVKSVVVPVKDSGHADTSELNAVISIGDRSYKVGGGGIHSIDGPGCYRSNDKESIVDIDVTSYYPAIIIQNNLWVNHSVAAINNLVQELLKISKAKNLEEIGVQIIRSPEKNDKLDPAARIILTTHQRFCRKGASQQWHRLAQDLIDVSDQRKIHIFIDECDQFFEGLVRVIPLDSMMRMDMMRDLNPNGDKSGVLTRLNSCPGRSNKSDCNNCQIELDTVCGTMSTKEQIQKYLTAQLELDLESHINSRFSQCLEFYTAAK